MQRERIKAYLVLFGLPDSFSEAQLKQAYRDLIQVWHPDRHAQNDRLRRKAEEKVKEINQAESALSGLMLGGRFDLRDFASVAEASPRSRGGAPAPAADFPPEPDDDFPVTRHTRGPWLVVAMGMLAVFFVVLAAARRGAAPAKDAGLAAGGAGGAPAKALVLSETLDARNGFKGFQLGMSVAAARELQAEDERFEPGAGDLVLLRYTRGAVLELGDYALGRIELRFDRDRLYRIEVGFGRDQERIHQAFVTAFGEPNEVEPVARNGRPLRVQRWEGRRVTATIAGPLAEGGATPWDTVVIADLELGGQARETERAEVAGALQSTGFKGLAFGMSAAEVNAALGRRLAVTADTGVGGTKLTIPAAADRRLASAGFQTADEVRCYFFQDRLYRVDLAFSREGEAWLEAFLGRFPEASANGSWKRGGVMVAARQWSDARWGAAILGTGAAAPKWDQIVLFDAELMQARKEYQDGATERAARDI